MYKKAWWSTNKPSDLPLIFRNGVLSYKLLFNKKKKPYISLIKFSKRGESVVKSLRVFSYEYIYRIYS